MAIYRKYERDVDVLLAEEFEVSPPFANWFLEQVQGFAHWKAQVLDVYVSKSDYLGESDLIVIFEAAETSFALFIEDKIDAPLQPHQAERYRLRADAGVRRGFCTEYKVVLCSPEAYPKTHPGASLFDAFVSYESIAAYLGTRDPEDRRSLYRANFLATAANRYTNSAAPIRDPGTTEFWKAAYEVATREFPDLEMKSP